MMFEFFFFLSFRTLHIHLLNVISYVPTIIADFSFSSGAPESGDLDGSHQLGQNKSILLFQDAGSNCSSIKDADCVRPIRSSALPPLQDLDIDVVKNLPTEIILEMDVLYKGELSDLIRKSKGSNCSTHVCFSTVSLMDASTNSADAGISDEHIDSVKLGLNSKDKGKMPICEVHSFSQSVLYILLLFPVD